MLTFDMGPLAKKLGCEAEVAAYTGPFIGWRFLAEVLREMPVPDGEAKAVVDPVIAGMDLLAAGKDWPKAAAAEARAAARAAAWEQWAHAAWSAGEAAWAAAPPLSAAWEARAAELAMWATRAAAAAWAARAAGEEAAWAAQAAAEAGLSFPRQCDILLRLMEEARE